MVRTVADTCTLRWMCVSRVERSRPDRYAATRMRLFDVTASEPAWCKKLMDCHFGQGSTRHQSVSTHTPVCNALQHVGGICVIALLHDQNTVWDTMGPPQQSSAPELPPLIQKAVRPCGCLLIMFLATFGHCCSDCSLQNEDRLDF